MRNRNLPMLLRNFRKDCPRDDYRPDQTKTYDVNGEEKDLPEGKYLPEIMHDFAVGFITQHKDEPFFLYYPMSHIHGPIVRTPDSKPDAGKDRLYADNIEYMDKLVGKLMAELDRLKLHAALNSPRTPAVKK